MSKINKMPSRRFANMKKSAKRRGLEIEITLDDWKNMMEEAEYECTYCGDDVKESSGGSLDRVDNEVGYVKENVEVCCGNCNHMKRHLGVEEFIMHVKKIVEKVT